MPQWFAREFRGGDGLNSFRGGGLSNGGIRWNRAGQSARPTWAMRYGVQTGHRWHLGHNHPARSLARLENRCGSIVSSVEVAVHSRHPTHAHLTCALTHALSSHLISSLESSLGLPSIQLPSVLSSPVLSAAILATSPSFTYPSPSTPHTGPGSGSLLLHRLHPTPTPANIGS